MGLRTKKEDRSQEPGMGEGSQAGSPASPSSARWKHRARVSGDRRCWAVWPEASHTMSLRLSYLICKVGHHGPSLGGGRVRRAARAFRSS